MTEQEQQKLNEWIAKQLGWEKSNGGSWLKHIDDCLIQCALRMPTFVSPPVHFAEVKREIERRGWSWNVGYNSFNPSKMSYKFHIWKTSNTTGYSQWAETEELAGCLAFKAAVEATDG